ncbi:MULTISPECIES: hypothetical protein [Gordonia]|uniref:hypothetical protein n=1 Tax=Gordonia TaxID=2053 RepID=UPI0007EA2B95|nr:hypothetical protein [Gordonia sp. 852002-50395_SCH5434458]OBC01473.1 hypothetical protein A5785_17510 [Gordonia sp. 852002-50395_SCH5434458]
MDQLLSDIQTRAQVTPWLPAVRVAGDVVTYGSLGEAITAYAAVVGKHGMSRDSAFYAAIMHTLPSLSSVGNPDRQGVIIDQIVGWLSRHLPPSTGDLRVAM